MKATPDRAIQLGELIRLARRRQRISLQEVARRIGLRDRSNIYRLEKGVTESLSPERAVALAEVLGEPPWRLLSHLGKLPAETIYELTEPRIIRALFEPSALSRDCRLAEKARSALRRIAVGQLADGWLLAGRYGGIEAPVNLEEMLQLNGIKVETKRAERLEVTLADGSLAIEVPAFEGESDQARRRFTVAHCAAHLALGVLRHRQVAITDPVERDADEFAGQVLMPSTAIRNAVDRLAGTVEMWDPGDSALVSRLAREFAVPMWLAAKRLGEDGALQEVVAR